MKIEYDIVHTRVDDFLQTREGLARPKKTRHQSLFVGEVAGLLCCTAYSHDLSTADIIDFLDRVQPHRISGVEEAVRGQYHYVDDLIAADIREHALYRPLEYRLMYHKPGRTQIGPGEFFFCFFSEDSVFGIDNQNHFDIILDGHKTELKGMGSRLTAGPEKLDEYAYEKDTERLMAVLPVSDAVSPLFYSRYVSITFSKTDWRDIVYHKPDGGLALLT